MVVGEKVKNVGMIPYRHRLRKEGTKKPSERKIGRAWNPGIFTRWYPSLSTTEPARVPDGFEHVVGMLLRACDAMSTQRTSAFERGPKDDGGRCKLDQILWPGYVRRNHGGTRSNVDAGPAG